MDQDAQEPIQERSLAGDSPTEGSMAIWGAAQTATYLSEGVRRSGLRVDALGAVDDPTGRLIDADFDGERYDDPRGGPQGREVQYLVAADVHLDPGPHLKAGRVLGTLEPLPRVLDSASQPAQLGEFTRSSGFKAAEQILESFGPIASIQVVSHCGRGQGTLHARLHDAMRMLERLCGALEMVDAMLVGPQAGQSREPVNAHIEAIPESGRDLTGHLGILVRHEPRAVGMISVSDQTCWERSIRLLGVGGTIEIDEAGVSWTDPSGRSIETRPPLEDPFAHACAQLGEELRDLVASPRRLPTSEPTIRTQAACEAVRLSCRTRGPEWVGKARELIERM